MNANRIKAARLEAGMSQTELAFRVGRALTSIHRYEAGQTPPLDVARRIARVLNTTLDDLFPPLTEEAA